MTKKIYVFLCTLIIERVLNEILNLKSENDTITEEITKNENNLTKIQQLQNESIRLMKENDSLN